MKKKTFLTMLFLFTLLLLHGCNKKPLPAPPASSENAASKDTMVQCSACSGTFSLGDAQQPKPNSPQIICPKCGKTVVPRPAKS